jgi:hypothetical protein
MLHGIYIALGVVISFSAMVQINGDLRARVRSFAQVYACTHVQVHTRTSTQTHTYTHTRKHIHTSTPTHTGTTQLLNTLRNKWF